MKKPYQIEDRRAMRRFESGLADSPEPVQLLLPAAEIAMAMKNGVGELIRQAGLALMEVLMEREVQEVVGERYRHRNGREAWRWGKERGWCRIDGQKVPVERFRVRQVEGPEVPLGSYLLFQHDPQFHRKLWQELMRGLSTRHYGRAVRRFAKAYGIEKSVVSEQFIEASREKLRELMERRLEGRAFCAVMIDGLAFDGETFVVALGINNDGRKMVLGLRQGATENATVVGELCAELEERGLDFTVARLYVLDGAKALSVAVKKRAGEAALIQRCQLHIAGRDPRFQRGGTSPPGQVPMSPVAWGQARWSNLPCRSRPDTLASEPSPEARANVQAVPKGNVWRRHGISNGYHWESSGIGWSSRLCNDEDSNGCGCMGKRSSRHPRRFEQRHERKEA